MYIQVCGNIELAAGHFDLFSSVSHILCIQLGFNSLDVCIVLKIVFESVQQKLHHEYHYVVHLG